MKSNVISNVVRRVTLVITDLTPDELSAILNAVGSSADFEVWWDAEEERDEKSVGGVFNFQGLSIEPVLDDTSIQSEYDDIITGLYRIIFSVPDWWNQKDQDNYIRDLRRFLKEKTGMNI